MKPFEGKIYVFAPKANQLSVRQKLLKVAAAYDLVLDQCVVLPLSDEELNSHLPAQKIVYVFRHHQNKPVFRKILKATAEYLQSYGGLVIFAAADSFPYKLNFED